MGSLITRLKYVLRRLGRSPMFTAVSLLTLAIGTGANTAVFSVLHGVMLKPLPYSNPEELVGIRHTAPGIGIEDLNTSRANHFVYRDENRTFASVGLWQVGSVSVTGLAEPEQVGVIRFTESVLPMLGVPPLHGRWFLPEDDQPGQPETAILSHGYWQRKFNGDPAAVGKTILTDGGSREIIGVMPERFRFLDRDPDIILPFQFDLAEVFVGNFSFQGIGRLKPGVTLEQANADVARMLPMIMERFPLPNGLSAEMFEDARIGPNVRPLMVDVIGDIGNVLWVLMAAVGIVLFIACANVANLLLVRAAGRQQEFAIRAALGASWSTIARELLWDTVTLGLLGGALGLGLAYGSLRLLVYLGPTNLPRLQEITIDPLVLAFAGATSLIAGLLFGLVPVIKYGRPHPAAALRGGSRGFSQGRERHRTQRSLVVMQVALALVLLIGSGLMIRTFQALQNVEPGFQDAEHILTMRLSIPNSQVKEPERVARMHHDLADRLAAIPGVASVGLSNSITMDGNDNNDPIFVEDKPLSENDLPPIRRFKHISPGYFQTMGNAILVGRDFTWTDVHETRPVVLISESFAREHWDSPATAVGKRIRENPKSPWREIIGVVGNERDDGISQPAPTIIYWPLLTKDFWTEGIAVRRTLAYAIRSERTGTESFLQEVQQAVWAVNPNLPIADPQPVQEIYQRSLAQTSFTLVMLAIAGAMALVLGVVGIYGVISYSISQRTREIGIRIALGASQSTVRGMFVRQGLWLVTLGVGCGLAAAIPLTRLMSSLLFEISPLDPTTYGAVSVALILAALLATYLPARRFTRVEPMDALRVE